MHRAIALRTRQGSAKVNRKRPVHAGPKQMMRRRPAFCHDINASTIHDPWPQGVASNKPRAHGVAAFIEIGVPDQIRPCAAEGATGDESGNEKSFLASQAVVAENLIQRSAMSKRFARPVGDPR
jgi:hypothetical protein